ncbi:MAG: class I SAM-dependent methyltransferase [Cyanobacteriota bacterium]|jgi:cyclopropane fatty-acyl-phospholipid synthase-like methyltransferase
MTPDLAPVADFFNAWSVYQQVFEHNYLDHRQIAQCLNQFLQENVREPLTALDLGCGDGVFSRRVFEGANLSAYCGVDLAEQALARAEENLQGVAPRLFFETAEITEFMAQTEQTFDLILASFCLHHLDAEQKQTFLSQARNRLNPRGRLIWVDIFRQEGQSRENYLARYQDIIQTHWREVDEAVKTAAFSHMAQSDYPETVSTWRTWAETLGYEIGDKLYDGAWETEQIWVLRRG